MIGNQDGDGLDGGPDADILWGGNGVDAIFGGSGDDTIYGGSGADVLFGGPGRDTFVFNSNQPRMDVIVDFEHGDRIDVRGVDGFFHPDEDFVLAYEVIPANSPTGQQASEILSLLGYETGFVDGSVGVLGVHIGEGQLDQDQHVTIILNGVLEATLQTDDYFHADNIVGSAWIANPDYFA